MRSAPGASAVTGCGISFPRSRDSAFRKGLGFSQTAQFYAIQDLAEAKDYLAHPVLGARLKEISSALLELDGLSASEIFGYPDDLKLRSSMTLFRLADLDCPIFQDVIDKYYDGEADKKTIRILRELDR